MRARTGALLLGLGLLGPCAAPHAATGAGWRTLDAGLDLGEFRSACGTIAGDSAVVILRIDPALWDLRVFSASASGSSGNLTAKEWCKREGLTAAINAGMFEGDRSTHVGYLRSGGQVNCAAANRYLSVAAFAPRHAGSPRFRIYDLDRPGVSLKAINSEYDCVAQNLRLIKRPGVNCWPPQERKWSEVALGEDAQGRVLFISARCPLSMHEFNRMLADLPIGLQCAQHLEGGPEAQLYVRTTGFELELAGSFETLFREDGDDDGAVPVPNVLGVVRRAVAAGH